MEVGQGPNWGYSVKEKKIVLTFGSLKDEEFLGQQRNFYLVNLLR
jgi:hypothetical protein